MHEYAITENIVNIVNQEALNRGFKRVSEISIAIGELSDVIDESVQMYFDIMSEGTLAEKAKLKFNKIKIEFLCNKCKREFPEYDADMACPFCGEKDITVSKGKEFYIEYIEAE